MQRGVVHNEHRTNNQDGHESNGENKAHVVPALFGVSAHVQEVVQMHQNLNQSES